MSLISVLLFSILILDVRSIYVELTERKLRDWSQPCLKEAVVNGLDLRVLSQKDLPDTHEDKCFVTCLARSWGFVSKLLNVKTKIFFYVILA